MLLAILDHKVPLEQLGLLDHKVFKALQDQPERPVQRDHKAPQALPVI